VTNGTCRIYTRPLQNGSGTTSANQELVGNNAGSGAFVNPAGTVLGTGPNTNFVFTGGGQYTLLLNITLSAANTLTISNSLFSGAGTGGTALYSQIATNVTGANLLTADFDGLCIGIFNKGASVNPIMDMTSVMVTGISTPNTNPPNITLQPLPAVVPSGGSCDYVVGAQGIGTLTYQWHRNGTNLLDGGNISGATTDTLIVSPATASDVASGANGYYVTITQPGANGPLSTNSNIVPLTLGTARNLVWNGPGTVWDLNTSANWLDPNNPAMFNFGDSVTFNGNPPTGVTLTGKYLSASSVTVDANYSFGGTGSFAGPGALIYRGGNFLEIDNANTYSGGTIVSNPTAYLFLRNYNALGTGPVTLAKPGLMEIVPVGSATVGIGGDIVVADDFNIQFDAGGTFSGVLLGNLSGTPGKVLTLTPNPINTTTNQRVRVYGNNTTYNANLNLSSSLITLAPYLPNGTQTYNGIISGSGNIIQRGNGVTILAGPNTYSGGTTPTSGAIGFGSDDDGSVGSIGSGPLLLAPETTAATGSGLVLASGGARTIANPIQNQNGTNNSTLIIGGTNDLTFSGPYTLNGNDNLLGTFSNRTVQVTNTALTTFSGVISDNGQAWGLIKTGNGILALNNTETYTGPTGVSNGTLRVNGQLGTGAVTVATNATLSGTGTVSGPVTVLAGGSISPGNSIGTLTLNNDLTLSGNLNIEVNKSAVPASDQVVVSGALSNTGTGTVTVTNLGSALAPGDAFTLFNKALTNGAVLAVTGAGVNWTNKLAIDGTIAVLAAIPATPTNISFSVSGNTLTLSWPSSYLGWSLQSNSVSLNSTNWFPVPNSSSVTQVVITVNPARANVFYRLVYP
jgi:autotransporter-associated beta strand protein